MAIAQSATVGGRRLLWIGTRNGGLSQLDRGRWRQFRAASGDLPSDMVQAIAEEVDPGGRGAMWVGTRGGLVAYDGEAFRRGDAAGPYPGESILCLRAASPPGGAREIWVGTSDGLALGKGGEWRRWGTKEGLRNPAVQALHLEVSPAGRRTLWIGTDGGGLYLLDPDGPRHVATPGRSRRLSAAAERLDLLDPRGRVATDLRPDQSGHHAAHAPRGRGGIAALRAVHDRARTAAESGEPGGGFSRRRRPALVRHGRRRGRVRSRRWSTSTTRRSASCSRRSGWVAPTAWCSTASSSRTIRTASTSG